MTLNKSKKVYWCEALQIHANSILIYYLSNYVLEVSLYYALHENNVHHSSS